MADSVQSSQDSPPVKCQKIENSDGSAHQNVLANFQIKSVLRDSTREKTIFVHGEVDNKSWSLANAVSFFFFSLTCVRCDTQLCLHSTNL